jgi:hypothetical protein
MYWTADSRTPRASGQRPVRNAAFAALALRRGAPLSGLPPKTGGRALVQRLEETRLLVPEWRDDAEPHLRADGDIEEARRQWEFALSALKERTARWPVS